VFPEIQTVWERAADASLAALPEAKVPDKVLLPAQYLVLVTCRDEKHQVELLQSLSAEGLPCRALLS